MRLEQQIGKVIDFGVASVAGLEVSNLAGKSRFSNASYHLRVRNLTEYKQIEFLKVDLYQLLRLYRDIIIAVLFPKLNLE